jgi:microcystin-dependent protein
MGQPYIGEIRIFAGNFAPVGWAICDGRLLSIDANENAGLFQLIGTTYGGNGQTNFALPDLRSRVPVHAGTSTGGTYTIGQSAGVESVVLLTSQLPKHTHIVNATNSGEVLVPSGSTYPAVATSQQAGELLVYGAAATADTTLVSTSITNDGGNLPHDNIQPFVAINFIIALTGVYPTQA